MTSQVWLCSDCGYYWSEGPACPDCHVGMIEMVRYEEEDLEWHRQNVAMVIWTAIAFVVAAWLVA